MSNVTVADIARHLGVSTATVSMTLRNKGRISEHTRQRVLRAIDELGYVYNQTAANLRNKSSNRGRSVAARHHQPPSMRR